MLLSGTRSDGYFAARYDVDTTFLSRLRFATLKVLLSNIGEIYIEFRGVIFKNADTHEVDAITLLHYYFCGDLHDTLAALISSNYINYAFRHF